MSTETDSARLDWQPPDYAILILIPILRLVGLCVYSLVKLPLEDAPERWPRSVRAGGTHDP